MGLNVFTLFTAFGAGSLLFQAALLLGFSTALALFGLTALAAALAVPLFATERPRPGGSPPPGLTPFRPGSLTLAGDPSRPDGYPRALPLARSRTAVTAGQRRRAPGSWEATCRATESTPGRLRPLQVANATGRSVAAVRCASTAPTGPGQSGTCPAPNNP